MKDEAALTHSLLSVTSSGHHFVSTSMLDGLSEEEEEVQEVQMVFKMEDLSEMLTHLEV